MIGDTEPEVFAPEHSGDFVYKQALDALADPVVAADKTNRIVYVNDATARLLGWTREELLGQPLSLIQPPRFREAHLAAFNRFMQTGEPTILGHPVRVPALHRDGTELDIELSLGVLSPADGSRMVLASLRDLRERVELERQLSATRYMRAAAEAAAALTSRLDFDDVLQTVVNTLVGSFDSALARVWLYDPEARTLRLEASAGILTGNAADFPTVIDVDTHPYKAAAVARTLRPFLTNSLIEEEEYDQAWVERENVASVAALPLLVEGQLRGVIVTFSRRILTDELVEALNLFATMVTTALHDVELYSREREARALAEEASGRLAFVAEASRVLTSSLDYETTLANVARLAVSELADWCVVDVVEDSGDLRRIEIASRDPERLDLARELRERYPEDGPSSRLQKVLSSGKPDLIEEIPPSILETIARNEEHLSLLRRLGLESYMAVPLIARGRALGAISFVSSAGRRFDAEDLDLAEHLGRRAAAAIDNARLYRDLQASMRVRDEFISSITHDLKNPLAAIKGQTQLLERRVRRMELEDDKKIISGLESILGTVNRMTRLLNNLLDVARLQMGTPLQLECALTDLVALLEQVVQDQSQATQDHTIRLETDRDEMVADVDALRIERVLTNLIGNAVKFTPDGGEIVVRLREETSDGTEWAVISVEDQGMGIPEDDLPHIFDRFHRGSNVIGKIPGSGIGLAGVKQIVEQHHGSIEMCSCEGEGTSVTVRLPLQRQTGD